jgi:ATP-binding cassette, subfamily B, bacterial
MATPSDTPRTRRARTSRDRYRSFVSDYRAGRIDEELQARAGALAPPPVETPAPEAAGGSALSRLFGGTRRQYAREYLGWLWPHRYRVGVVFGLALMVAGLEMVQPLFMRAIIDGVLLDQSLDAATRLRRLNVIGGLFLLLVVSEQVLNVTKNYRQKLLNARVMVSLRRALFHRLVRSTARCARTPRRSTAASARRSRASAWCARSAVRFANCATTCTAGTACCARSCSHTGVSC